MHTPAAATKHHVFRSIGLSLVLGIMMLGGLSGDRVFADVGCPPGMSQLDCSALYGDWTGWVPDTCPSVTTQSTNDVENALNDPHLYTGNPHIKAAFQFFVQHGYSPAQSAGIVGNLMQESGASIDPKASDGVAHGIAQWQGGRLQPMYTWVTAWATQNNDPAGKDSFEGQLNYLIYDLDHQRTGIRDAIKNIASPEDAAVYWNRNYEISGDYTDIRPTYARGVLEAANDNNWTSGLAVTNPAGSNTLATNFGCSNGVIGTVVGTTCANISKASATTLNPYVCKNSEVKCPTGTDAGVGQGYAGGVEYDIRLCRVQGVTVNAFVASNIDAMITTAASSGIRLSGGGFRTLQDQITVRTSNCGPTQYDIYEKPAGDCHPPAARPKFSNHQMGLAVDLNS